MQCFWVAGLRWHVFWSWLAASFLNLLSSRRKVFIHFSSVFGVLIGPSVTLRLQGRLNPRKEIPVHSAERALLFIKVILLVVITPASDDACVASFRRRGSSDDPDLDSSCANKGRFLPDQVRQRVGMTMNLC